LGDAIFTQFQARSAAPTIPAGMNDFTRSVAAALSLILSLDSELIDIVLLSLRVSLSASAIALVIGAPAGTLLAITRFPGRQTIIVLVNALLGLPPVVAGLAIYLLLSRSGARSDPPACCSRQPR
jgi:tungstate transport system permease protein